MVFQNARAELHGGPDTPKLHGTVAFTRENGGTWVRARVYGLPLPKKGDRVRFFGFHVHEKGDCTTAPGEEAFAATGGHYNPTDSAHGGHAGDLPALISSGGMAEMEFFTGGFLPEEVVGRSVVIHAHPDDFHTSPAGNSGPKIACGRIFGDR